MKALVTGASGFIGSTLIEALGQRGFEVAALMRKTSSSANLRGLKYTRREGDLSDFESLKRAVEGVDVVFHLAGVVAAKNRDEYFQHNQGGCERLARAISENGASVKRVIYVSSLAAGGPSEDWNPRVETQADRPVSAYGESKKAGEDSFFQFSNRFRTVVLRPPIVYGPRDSGSGAYLLIKAAKSRVVPSISSRAPDGERYYSMVYVDDLVQAMIQAAEMPHNRLAEREVLYVTSDVRVTFREMMKAAAQSLGVRVWYIPVPKILLVIVSKILTWISQVSGKTFMLNDDKIHEVLPDNWTCSNEKVKETLSWKPETFLTQGMNKTVQWYKSKGWI